MSRKTFTFQSGFILMVFMDYRLKFDLYFTFQSGFILIKAENVEKWGSKNFTFQSGFILIIYSPAFVI